MRLPIRPPTIARDDDAIVSVLGAILIAGLIVTILATIQGSYVPVWEERAESGLMKRVVQDLGDVKSALDRQTQNVTSVPATTTLPMGDDSFSMFAPARVPNQILFERADVNVDVNATTILLTEVNGTSQIGSGPNEVWQDVGTTPVEDIVEILSLRIRLDEIHRNYATDRVWLNISHMGDPDEHLGTFRANIVSDPPDYAVNYFVFCHVCSGDDLDKTLYDQPETFFQVEGHSPFWINVLEDRYRFDRILEVAEPPMRMTLQFFCEWGTGSPDKDCNDSRGGGDEDLSGVYAISYIKETENGTVLIGGSGFTVDDFNRSFGDRAMGNGRLVPGRLMYRGFNTFFPQQDYVLEHGALVVSQPQGASFVVEPAFSAALIGQETSVKFLLPSMVGQPMGLSGQSAAKVRTTPLATQSVEGRAPDFTVNLTTEFPDLWTRFWSRTLEDAGHVNGTHFNVTQGDGWAKLVVTGFRLPDPGRSSLDDADITVSFRQSIVRVDVVA